MSQARLEFRIRGIEFVGDGDPSWVAEQLDKILQQVPELLDIAGGAVAPDVGAGEVTAPKPVSSQNGHADLKSVPLPSFLKKHNAVKSQNDRFLAAATWLQLRGKHRLQPGDISRALSESNQSRLSNPSDTLAQNIAKGFCERDGKQFFVTEEGMRHLGVAHE